MTIAYGSLIRCDIDIVGDTDIFRFGASSGETVVAQVTMLGSAEARLELFDPDGILVDFDTGFTEAQVRVSLTKSGSYSLLVEERDDDETSEYNLALERISPPTPGSPRVVFGSESSAKIEARGDLDLYHFEAALGEAVAVQSTMLGSAESRIEVFDPDGFLLAFDTGFTAARVDSMIEKTGVHSLLIKERDDDETDSFTLALERTSECRGQSAVDLSGETISTTEIVEACDSITAGDGYEVDSSGDVTLLTGGSVALRNGFAVRNGGSLTVVSPAWGTPIDYGDDVRATLTPRGDLTAFRFSAQAGETLVAQATMLGSAESRIEVYDPDGFLLAFDTGFNDARVDVDLTETGRHTILVKERDDDEVDDFTLVLERATPPSPAARSLCFGCELRDDVDPVGDIDMFTFTAAGTETISAQVTMLGSAEARIELYDPDGILITFDTGFSTASIDTTLTKPGSHSLLVKERDDDEIDSYDISLQCVAGCSP